MTAKQHRIPRNLGRRLWQAIFALLCTTVVMAEAGNDSTTAKTLEFSPNALRSSATADSIAQLINDNRILITGDTSSDCTDVSLEAGQPILLRWNDTERSLVTRENENLNTLLFRAGITPGPLDVIRIITDEEQIQIEVATDFTYYEDGQRPVGFETIHQTDYRIPKGEQLVVQEGKTGTVDVTYEVVYADGQLVSRQAINEENDTSVDAIVKDGLLVTEAQEGDTIVSVIREDDGSGYLLMASGDALHFSRTKEVSCTAYTTGYGGVGTITYSSTPVHVGVCAVDKSVIPLGSKMFVTTQDGHYTYGMASAEDTGVFGNVVDLFMNSYEECIRFGRRNSILYFLD